MALRFLIRPNRVSRLLRQHFGATPIERLLAATRTFPVTSRVDLQVALDKLFAERFRARLVGVHPEFCHETLTISHLASDGQMPVLVGALQHDEIDVGEAMPARCLKHGLWLARKDSLPFAVLVTAAERFGRETGVALEIAVPQEEAGAELSRSFITELMRRAAQYQLQEGNDGALAVRHVESALEEMLFSGGSLNVKLLGGAVEA